MDEAGASPDSGGVSQPSPSNLKSNEEVIFGTIDPNLLCQGQKNQDDNNNSQNDQDPKKDRPQVTSSTCRPIAKERPRIELPGDIIDNRIEFMQDHAVIGKFIGFWPTERALRGWIAAKWKPKGDVTLQLGAKGFFTTIFYCLEDKHRILGGGPYFFNSAGLYLRNWKPRFNPDNEDLAWAPVWIRLFSLLDEYWEEQCLMKIGNGVGKYIRAAEETKNRKFISYARICVFIRLNEALPDSVTLTHRDEDWIQPLDYEHVPFRCRRCHVIGHLFRDCPLNAKTSVPETSDTSPQDGFTKVTNRKRMHKKPQNGPKPQPSKTQNHASKNSYESLGNLPEDSTPIHEGMPPRASSPMPPPLPPCPPSSSSSLSRLSPLPLPASPPLPKILPSSSHQF
eukprot:PITA_25482